jgi:hypothetical protein
MYYHIFSRPEIVELLITKQADVSTIDMHELYHLQEVNYNIDKLKPKLQDIQKIWKIVKVKRDIQLVKNDGAFNLE